MNSLEMSDKDGVPIWDMTMSSSARSIFSTWVAPASPKAASPQR